MAVISATRIRVRLRHLPAFLRATRASAAQLERSPGFVAGRLRLEPTGAFWTLSMWRSADDMSGYRDSGAHADVAPQLDEWATEAMFSTWHTDADRLPGWREVSRRVAANPTYAPLSGPTRRHRQRQPMPARRIGFDLPARPRHGRTVRAELT